MSTKNQMISDIELRLYQGKPSDDIELSRSHVSYLIDVTRSDILSDIFDDKIRRGEQIDPFYIEKEECLATSKETTSCDKDCKEFRYYFTPTKEIMQLHLDGGIVRVVDNFGRSLAGTNQNFSEVLSGLPYASTSTKNQTFYREGSNVYIQELTQESFNLYEYNIYFIPQSVDSSLDDDSEYPIEEALVGLLLDRVEEILRRQMQLGVADLDNDGTDPYHL